MTGCFLKLCFLPLLQSLCGSAVLVFTDVLSANTPIDGQCFTLQWMNREYIALLGTSGTVTVWQLGIFSSRERRDVERSAQSGQTFGRSPESKTPELVKPAGLRTLTHPRTQNVLVIVLMKQSVE